MSSDVSLLERFLRSLRLTLLEPSARITDIYARRAALVLSSAILAMISTFGVLDFYRAVTDPAYSVPWHGYLLLVSGYALSRSPYYRIGVGIIVIMFPIVTSWIFLVGMTGHPEAPLHYNALAVLFAALFFSRRWTMVFAAVIAASLLVLPLLAPTPVPEDTIARPLVAVVLVSVFVLLLPYLRAVVGPPPSPDTEHLQLALSAGQTAAWDLDLTRRTFTWSGAAADFFGRPQGSLPRSLGEFLSLVHEDDRAFVEGMVSRQQEERGGLRPGEFRIIRPDGSIRWASAIGRVVRSDDDRPIRLIGMISDITDRIETRRALERQVKELRALSSIGFICSEATTTDELISRVTEIVGRTLYPDNFGFLLVRPSDRMLVHHPSYLLTSPGSTVADIPIGSGITGWVAANGVPKRAGDTSAEPNYRNLAEGMISEICVPVLVGKDVIGVIDAESGRPDAFTDEDERLLMTIASEISVAWKRITAEHELRDKKELLARSQELARLGSWEWDLPSNKTHWSDELAKMFGEPRGGAFPFDLDKVHPEDRGLVESTLRSGMESGTVPPIELRIIRTDGSIRTILGQGSVVKDPKGIPIRVIGTAMDISDVRQAEDKFVKAFRSIHDAMVIVKVPTAELVEVNDGFTRLSGYSRAEAVGKTPAELGMWMSAEDGTRFREALSRGEDLKNFEVELLDKDRRTHSCLISAELIDIEGRRHAVAIARDITDRKQLEERLLQSQKLESIGRLAGGIAHDFNNYLSAIMGYADMAAKRAGDERSRAFMQNILTASEKASHLTRQLLAFARKQIIEPRVVSLNAVVENAEKMLRRLIGEDTELIIRTQKNLPNVKIDPNQFDQVLVNLVVNARDAMPRGGQIVITTSRARIRDDDPHRGPHMTGEQYVSMTISDTGSGIQPDVLENIFEPFFTTKPQGQGTGLGLPTCLGIVEQNGGTIYVQQTSPKGTVFRLLLPTVTELGVIEADADTSDLPRGTETILFVEDEHMVREIGVETLKDLGYKVFPAANGPEALLFATTYRGHIDILVTDVVMPQMSGRELADQIRKIRSSTKLLYTSGYTESIISQHGILNSGITLLQKPYSPRTLAVRVREILDGAEPRKS